MTLNLISDPWLPVRCTDGSRRIIAPWQMAEPGIESPDWPRPDLNIACMELLIGLVYLADPPKDIEDWDDRRTPDPARLREKLAGLEPAFNLLGDGPLFLQDLEPLQGEANTPDMLFIDSAGANTARNNADLMVHRDRYPALNLPLAAMALYTFQAFAPSGGAGNRTSMRGGGPLVTLADPGRGLWALVWANVPYGRPAAPESLPWMRATRASDKGLETDPPEDALFGPEAFFGMPRRLRLVADASGVTGVIQRPYGTNYARWKHPLSPYYRMKPGTEWLPKHPRAGRFGYRNWLGIIAREAGNDLAELSLSLRDWGQRHGGGSVIVAGWAMDNMKPRDFTLSAEPFPDLAPETEDRLVALIRGAEAAGVALRGALEPVLAGGEAREAEREAFFLATVWAAFLYVALSSVATHLLGRPLKSALFVQEKREADFRHALIQLRENANAIAVAGGETAEARRLDRLFGAVRANWNLLIRRELVLGLFSRPYFQTVLRIPTFLALPAYFAGAVTLGGLMQLASAFSNVTTTLSWFIFSYRDLAAFVAVSERLDGLLRSAQMPPLQDLPQQIERLPADVLALSGLQLHTPDGRALAPVPDITVAPGDTVWIRGASGQGKSTLLAALAGLWPYGTGRIAAPEGMRILPQEPRLLSEGVAASVSYPEPPGAHTPEQLAEALRQSGLGTLSAEARVEDLSGGERQRLALARLFLARPGWVVLDEATSALDPCTEEQVLHNLRVALPDAAILCVSHRRPDALGPLRILDIG